MERKSVLAISCLLFATMFITLIPKIPIAQATNGTYLKIVSDITELGPDNAIDQTFTVKCNVENITSLYGVDIQINWTTEYIQYVSHVKKIPVETYPDGILHSPTIPVKNIVDETASIPGAVAGTMYLLAEASMLPAIGFDGNGTAFEMTFKVKKHPQGTDSHIYINFTSSTLAHISGNPIDHTQVNLHILLHGRLQPSGPKIEISTPSPYKGTVPYTFDVDVLIWNLDPYWDLGGFDVQVSYDPEIIEATSIDVDPDDWFSSFWTDTLVVMSNIDNTAGKVWVALLGLPEENGTHIEPYGNATLFTVTFEALASGPIEKIEDEFSFAAFPHPERPEAPFNNAEWSVPIPFTVTQGFADIVGVMDHTPLAGYTVTTESTSYVSSMSFTPGIPELYFTVTGADGYSGYCNITIPNNFMWSQITDGFIVRVNGQKITPTVTEDSQNTYIYFTYQHSTHHITITTTNAIPEFGLTTFTIFALSALAFALAKKKLIGKKEK